MTAFVNSAKVFESKTPLIWMGGYLATCRLGGAIRKVELSVYGGYFYDEKTGEYYKLSAEKTDAWISFLQDSYTTAFKTKESKN
jgi:hypothetical protein